MLALRLYNRPSLFSTLCYNTCSLSTLLDSLKIIKQSGPITLIPDDQDNFHVTAINVTVVIVQIGLKVDRCRYKYSFGRHICVWEFPLHLKFRITLKPVNDDF